MELHERCGNMKQTKDIERFEEILASGTKSRRSDAAEQGNKAASKTLAKLIAENGNLTKEESK